jgi:hypothetical protein
LLEEFANVRFFVARQSRIQRLYDDCGYLPAITRETGQPDLYYAYGIPLYFRCARVNWFHLSNVLPLGTMAIPLPRLERWKAAFLGRRIRAGLERADVISAESQNSLNMLGTAMSRKLFVSVNGSDDEIAQLRSTDSSATENVATVVGTTAYKALDDSYRVFEMLRMGNSDLKLAMIGNPEWVPRSIRGKAGLVAFGVLSRAAVMDYLRKSRYYISTTCVENSYNAAAEGMFLAEEAYVSDIGPHRELLAGERFDEVSVPGVKRTLLKVRRHELSGINLKSWDTVIAEMIARCRDAVKDL